MAALNCLDPHLEPRATAFVPHMISTISRIIDNGHAYAVEGGDVFFDVASLPGYGRLSGRAQEDNRCVAIVLLLATLKCTFSVGNMSVVSGRGTAGSSWALGATGAT